MDSLYIFIFGAIGIIIAIGVGIEISKGIEEFVIYLLFWMLYIVTIATFINIFLVANYYLTMKDKTGQPGPQGPIGDSGDNGNAGLCDPTCGDSICENKIIDMITESLKNSPGSDSTVRFNNIYIKSKVRQMCGSDEFKQLAPYNGPQNLNNYLTDIWKIWFDKLYESGGLKYFENIAAETEFDWINDNPFQEIKQYDVFYWGMGKQYRPEIVDKCYNSTNGNTPDSNDSSGKIVRASPTTLYDELGNSDGSGAENKVSFWRAKQYTYKSAVYYPVGDIAIGPNRARDNANLKRRVGSITLDTSSGPNRETIIVSGDVVGPIDYDLIWTNKKLWFWRPIAPLNYISLGDVVTFDKDQPATGDNAPIRCVPYNITLRINPSGNILWSSYGDTASTNALLLGFKPNDGSFVSSGLNTDDSNCYNMFRTIIGMDSTNIPESDVNGGFYYLDATKYDSAFIIGTDYGSANSDSSNLVGKGYIKFPKKDAKYSVLSYLNLKNNPVLIHQMTNLEITAKLIPNAISNSYLISLSSNKNQCINFDGTSLTRKNVCDEYNTSQIFSIMFTGNKKNECKLQHNDTKNVIKYQDGVLTLVEHDEQNNIENQLFIMQ